MWPGHLREHLEGCTGCRAWASRCERVTRRARVGGPLPPDELTDRIVRAVAADIERRRSRRQWTLAAALVALSGVVQLLVSLPLLLMAGRPHGSLGWEVLLEFVIGSSFFAGALVLLWHSRTPVEPVGILTVADAGATGSTSMDRVA